MNNDGADRLFEFVGHLQAGTVAFFAGAMFGLAFVALGLLHARGCFFESFERLGNRTNFVGPVMIGDGDVEIALFQIGNHPGNTGHRAGNHGVGRQQDHRYHNDQKYHTTDQGCIAQVIGRGINGGKRHVDDYAPLVGITFNGDRNDQVHDFAIVNLTGLARLHRFKNGRVGWIGDIKFGAADIGVFMGNPCALCGNKIDGAGAKRGQFGKPFRQRIQFKIDTHNTKKLSAAVLHRIDKRCQNHIAALNVIGNRIGQVGLIGAFWFGVIFIDLRVIEPGQVIGGNAATEVIIIGDIFSAAVAKRFAFALVIGILAVKGVGFKSGPRPGKGGVVHQGAIEDFVIGLAVCSALFTKCAKGTCKVFGNQHPAIQHPAGLFGMELANGTGFAHGQLFGCFAGLDSLKEDADDQTEGNCECTDAGQLGTKRHIGKSH